MSQRNSNLFVMGLILASAALAILRFDSLQIGTSYDDAKYIILAESLASGQGYELINFPRPQIERNFPPGWPLVLAPFTLVFPKNYDALKVVSLVLWLVSILWVYKLFSKRLNSPYLEILTALVALNPLLIGTSVTVMSESAYLFFSLLALLTFDKVDDKKLGWLILAAILAFYTQQVRTIGIALIASLLILLLLKRRFKDLSFVAAIFVIGFLIQAGINLRNGGTVISSGYEAQVLSGSMIEKAGQVWSNASGYLNQVLAGSLIPIFGTRLDTMFSWLFLLLNIAILFLLVLGMLTTKLKFEWMHIYFVIYMAGILAFWNPQVGSVKARFLIPILPLLYFYFLRGVQWLLSTLFTQNTTTTTRSLFAVTLFISVVMIARNLQDWRSPIREQMTDLSIGASWVAENAPADALVMVNEPVPAYVHVQRKTINFPKNGQDLQQYLDNQGIDYIIIAPLLQSPKSTELTKDVKEILLMLETSPEIFVPAFEDSENNVRVYGYKGQ
ncbi:MAG: glycosyltransferase family 39 protein [Anaerolineales bacterium]|nr:glycosyltransferase family 39 protein [Anaerolineales bacterium]